MNAPGRRWLTLRAFSGWRPADLGPDLIAGLTLAAIAIPEQMATARLGGFPAQIGFLAIIAGAVGFVVFGASRVMSVGADSTITPIFAGSAALAVAAGSPHYAALAAMLALMIGALVALAGLFRLGWIADLLSVPVTTGFLAGIAGRIVLSQAPAVLGIAAPDGAVLDRLGALAGALGHVNVFTLAIGLGVLALMLAGERLGPRFPGALIALALATALVARFGLEGRGVATLGALAATTPRLAVPWVTLNEIVRLAPLAILVAMVVMVQSAATSRAFVGGDDRQPDVDRDFIGVGAAGVLAGLIGAFPVNASPPRTAVVSETGGRTQGASLVCAGIVLALAVFGAGLLTHTPQAALAGVLLFVAQRIVRVSVFVDVWRRGRAEFALIVATTLAIFVLPVQQGVAIGIILSLLHGVWTTTRARLVEFERIPGTSIWWPRGAAPVGETQPGVLVVAYQAPLSFLNAYDFQRALETLAASRAASLKLVVLEADSIAGVDYTAAAAFGAAMRALRARGIDFAVARLESTRAQDAFRRFGLIEALGPDHLFRSVDEALRALAPSAAA